MVFFLGQIRALIMTDMKINISNQTKNLKKKKKKWKVGDKSRKQNQESYLEVYFKNQTQR